MAMESVVLAILAVAMGVGLGAMALGGLLLIVMALNAGMWSLRGRKSLRKRMNISSSTPSGSQIITPSAEKATKPLLHRQNVPRGP